ncbi:hypothetical protein BK126_14835 [Paenibacillus sp. FSL H7-0326]|uniref:metallophosphoesterase family protein n=1 Tax=Paenibacillus sp. FSL H7-0326 TaxID=1921144 RepID=UPI00096FFD7B|nr:metallophosphoesterase [Paenibacillus sp. FSL H7-0326]OMC69054.1 hypothetical protein BK126_14835 [Paenibacillus sp. FSL H7-0326]
MITQVNSKRNEVFVDGSRIETSKRPWFGQLPEALPAQYSFAVMGDRCGMMTPGVFEQGLELLKDLNPEFVLFVGDLVEGYWKDADKAREEWDYIDAQIEATGLPFFQTIGNHDFGTQAMVDVWRERKGHEYYAFRAGDQLFLTLNTEDPFEEMPDEMIELIKRSTEKVHADPEHTMEYMKEFYEEITKGLTPEQLQSMGKVGIGISAEQLAFFEKVLEDNKDVKHTFVSMHKPGWKADSAEFARLEAMLQDREYTMFAGHFHTLEYTADANRTYIQLGRTGAGAHGIGRADDNLILWVTVNEDRVSYRVIHLDGVTDVMAYPPQLHHQD